MDENVDEINNRKENIISLILKKYNKTFDENKVNENVVEEEENIVTEEDINKTKAEFKKLLLEVADVEKETKCIIKTKDLFENNKSLLPGISYQTPTPSATDILNVITTTGVKGRQQDLNAPLIPTELAKRGIAKTKAPSVQPKPPATEPRTEFPVLDRNMMTASTTPTAGSITNIPQEQLNKYNTLFGPLV
jgi:hypothetical protein